LGGAEKQKAKSQKLKSQKEPPAAKEKNWLQE
jgi:hypothetical protein